MPQVSVSPSAGLLPPGVTFDTFATESDSDAALLLDSPKRPAVFQRFLNSTDSDNDLPCSQQSSTSTCSQSFEMYNKTVATRQGSELFSELGAFAVPSMEYTDLHRVQAQHAGLDEGALYPTSAALPRSLTPVPMDDDSNASMSPPSMVNEVTPTKPPQQEVDPLTPTANLKMLISAASPEIRNREKLLKKLERRDDEETADEFDVEEEQEPAVGRVKKLKKRKKAVRNVTAEDVTDEEDEDEEEDRSSEPMLIEAQPVVGRKEKSLGLLCQRFMQLYPQMPSATAKIEICLDEVAQRLVVERRRIYDIVNVLESVEMVSRIAKNKYAWHGRTNLLHTLLKLKSLAEADQYPAKLDVLIEYESMIAAKANSKNRNKKGAANNTVPALPPHVLQPLTTEAELETTKLISGGDSSVRGDGGGRGCEVRADSTYTIPEHKACKNFWHSKDMLRKDKSLGIMSQKFLMLFLVSKTKMINLEMAAKILIGDPNGDKTATAKFKTKIRRLYDIANILTSLELVRKVHIAETRARKPAFVYTGPSLEDQNLESTGCSIDGCHRPSSKQSLLDCVQNPKVCSLLDHNHNSKAKVTGRGVNSKRVLSRHASFEQLCAVSEQEINRLYFESNSPSPGSSTAPKASTKTILKAHPPSKIGRPPKKSTKSSSLPSTTTSSPVPSSTAAATTVNNRTGEISIVAPGQPSAIVEILKTGTGEEQLCLVQLPVSSLLQQQQQIFIPAASLPAAFKRTQDRSENIASHAASATTVKRALSALDTQENIATPPSKRICLEKDNGGKKRPSPIRSLHLSPAFSDPLGMSPNCLGVEFPGFPSPIPASGMQGKSTLNPPKSELNTPTLPELQGSSFQFPTSTAAEGAVTPTFRLGHSGSPIMLLSNHESPVSQANVRVPMGKFNSCGISPLVSLVPFSGNNTVFQITPTTTKPRLNNIQPSTKKIVNLMPVFSEGKTGDVNGDKPPTIKVIPPSKPSVPSNMAAVPTHNGSFGNRGVMKQLTPLSHVMDSGIVRADENNQTPQQVRGKEDIALATPGTYFHSTPGGELAQGGVFIINPYSAFEQVGSSSSSSSSSSSNGVIGAQSALSTARRLPL